MAVKTEWESSDIKDPYTIWIINQQLWSAVKVPDLCSANPGLTPAGTRMNHLAASVRESGQHCYSTPDKLYMRKWTMLKGLIFFEILSVSLSSLTAIFQVHLD